MSAKDYPWCDASLGEIDQNVLFGDAEDATLRAAHGSCHSSLLSMFDDTGLPEKMLWASRLPPSVQFAVDHPQLEALNQHVVPNESLTQEVSGSDEGNVEMATAQFSFSQRSLQYQYDVGAQPKRDSGLGISKDLFDFDGPGILVDDPSDDFSLLQNEHCDCPSTPLQYHLLESKGTMVRQEVEASNSTPPDVPSLTVSPSSSSDAPTSACPLCPDKRYKGLWAHRNLTRHMDTVHAPFSSTGGVRHFPCSHGDCERMFRREDARLVHERRNHPDLNRPPPNRRRRSGELRS